MAPDRYMGPDDWDRWRGEVTERIKSLTLDQQRTADMLHEVRDDLATLKGRAAGVGAMAGFIVTGLIELLVQLWRR